MGSKPHVRIFISCASKEFGSYREALRKALKRDNVDVHVQEDFSPGGVPTLDKLNTYIEGCDAVIHLVGGIPGAMAKAQSVEAIKELCPGLADRLPCLRPTLETGQPEISYTQWEAYLALYHRKRLLIALPGATADDSLEGEPEQVVAQLAHLRRLESLERYPEIRFASEDKLANAVLNALVSVLAKSEAGRKRNRILVAAAVAIVAVAVGGLVWHAIDQRRQHAAQIERQADEQKRRDAEQRARDEASAQNMAEMKALIERLAAGSQTPAAPGAREAIGEAVAAAKEGADQGDTRLKQALDLLQANKIAEAEALFRAVAEEKASRVARDSTDAAAAYRNLGAIAGLGDPKRALDAYEKAVALGPDDIESLYWIGAIQVDRGYLDAAENAFRKVLAIASGDNRSLHRYWAQLGIGDIFRARGNLGSAMTAYREGAELADRLAKADPNDARWQFHLGISSERVGDVLMAQGDLASALTSFQARHGTIDRLAKADPNNAGWQRDLSVSYNKVGSVLEAQGNLAAALTSYRGGLAIRERLTKAAPNNAGWQRDLSVSYEKVGDVLEAQGNLAAALTSYRDSLAIRERLAIADPNNAGWQRDLSVSYNKLGNVHVAQGNLSEALKSYQADLAITDRLAKADPHNAGWQRDLSVSYEKVGDVLEAQGNLAAALTSYRDSLAIADRLAKADPHNAGWQRDLSVSYNKVADVLVAQGSLAAALTSYRDSLAIADRLAKADPRNVQWQVDVLWLHWRLANRGDNPAHRWPLIVETLRKLKAEDRLTHEQATKWLPEAERRLADVKKK